jgi:hypothetical protein
LVTVSLARFAAVKKPPILAGHLVDFRVVTPAS